MVSFHDDISTLTGPQQRITLVFTFSRPGHQKVMEPTPSMSTGGTFLCCATCEVVVGLASLISLETLSGIPVPPRAVWTPSMM